MSAIIEQAKQDRDALVAELERAGGRIVGGKTFACPFHGPDRHPSGSIFETEAGGWAARCHKCGETWDFWDLKARNEGRAVEELMREAAKTAEGLDSRPVAARSAPGATQGAGEGRKAARRYANVEAVKASFGDRLAAAYAYTDPASGRVDLLVIRTEPKSFLQFHQEAPGGEILSGGPAKPWPVYNRARVAESESVVIVEGEKDVHALHRLGIVATTSPGGAATPTAENPEGADKAQYADWRPLAGKRVILWPDNDAPGEAHMRHVRRHLEALTPPPLISWLDPAMLSLGPKEDASDFIATLDGMTIDDQRATLRDVLALAEPLGAAADLRRQLRDIAEGRRRAVHLHHAMTSKLTQCLLPGTITIVCGTPGSTKSFWLQEALMHLHAAGVAVALLHLEEDRTFHLRRALAQLAGESSLTDETWIAEHPGEALALADRFETAIQSFGARITDTPGQTATYEAVAGFVESQAKAGARVIAVDPITLADPGATRKTWDADRQLVAGLKASAVRHGASVVLVSHPSKGANGGFLDSIAGGAAFQRAAQTVLWLEHLAAPLEDCIVRTPALSHRPSVLEPVNRILHVAKARNGRGTGMQIAFHFDARTLRSRELGIVERVGKGGRGR